MFIIGLGTAAPPKRFTQVECWEAVQTTAQFANLDRRARATVQGLLLRDNGIRARALALESLNEVFTTDPDTLHRRFARHAPVLASKAAADALQQANVRPHDIDAVIVSTCTGYLCPGLTSYVAERLGLLPNIIALDLVGQGCGAALPNLRMAESLLIAKRAKAVLSICVEVCSAAFYVDNDPGVLVSACLFGDGAGAAVLASAPNARARRVEWMAAGSVCDPNKRDALRFEQREGMLRNILTAEVPALAAQYAEIVLDQVLADEEMSRAEIDTWIWHAGGKKVLEALQARLGLTASDVRWSSNVLEEFGNLSSAFVYFVLQAALRDNAASGSWWMSSFGAGFSCHGALLEVA